MHRDMIKQTLPIKVVKLEGWPVHWKESQKLVNIRQTFKMTNVINLLKPTGHVMHLEFKVQQLYALPTLYLCVLYLSENKQRLAPLIS